MSVVRTFKMDKIHDKANKFFNDVRKKKIVAGKYIHKSNKEQAKQPQYPIPDLSSNCCLYCQKVFINSKYLVKHLVRRHSDDLVLLHKRCLKHESNNNSGDLQWLASFLETKFSLLENELITVKRKFDNSTYDDTEIPNENQSSESAASNRKANDNANINTDSNELKVLKEKIGYIENNIESLQNKFEVLDNVLKNEVLLSQEIKEKMLSAQETQFIEFRQILLNDLQTVLSKHENDTEWNFQLSEVKQDIKKLFWDIEKITKQINSSESLKRIEKKIERQVTHFLGTRKQSGQRAKNSKFKTEVSGTKTCSPQEKNLKIQMFDKIGVPAKCTREAEVSPVPADVHFMLAEKLSQFNIPSNISKISCSDYSEKLKLINSDKEHLIEKYPNFSEKYDKINIYADHAVNAKLKTKKSRRIRFSEPLTSGKVSPKSRKNNESCICKMLSVSLNEHEQYDSVESGKLCEGEQKKIVVVSGDGFNMPDVGASGDFSRNLLDNQNISFQPIESSSVKEFKTSSPIRDLPSSKKLNVTFSKNQYLEPSNSDKVLDCVSSKIRKKSDSIIVEYPEQNTGTPFVEAEYESNSDDEISLESLSSWEDDHLESFEKENS